MTPDEKKEKPETTPATPQKPQKPQMPEPEKWPMPLPTDPDSLQKVQRRENDESLNEQKKTGQA